MAPVACWESDHNELTGGGITSIISYWPVNQKTNWCNAHICLGENPTIAFKCFDLYYSFKLLCYAEYGGTRQLHLATKNYMRYYAPSAGQYQPQKISYEHALRNLFVLMF